MTFDRELRQFALSIGHQDKRLYQLRCLVLAAQSLPTKSHAATQSLLADPSNALSTDALVIPKRKARSASPETPVPSTESTSETLNSASKKRHQYRMIRTRPSCRSGCVLSSRRFRLGKQQGQNQGQGHVSEYAAASDGNCIKWERSQSALCSPRAQPAACRLATECTRSGSFASHPGDLQPLRFPEDAGAQSPVLQRALRDLSRAEGQDLGDRRGESDQILTRLPDCLEQGPTGQLIWPEGAAQIPRNGAQAVLSLESRALLLGHTGAVIVSRMWTFRLRLPQQLHELSTTPLLLVSMVDCMPGIRLRLRQIPLSDWWRRRDGIR